MLAPRQPVGIFAGSATHLLLPLPHPDQELSQVESVALEQILLGHNTMDVPEDWQYFIAATEGNIARSRELLESAYQQLCDRPAWQTRDQTLLREWFTYNCLVLNPGDETWQRVQSILTVPLLKSLAQVVAFAYGLSDDLPSIDCLNGELRAWAMAAFVTKQVEQENYLAARQLLAEAIQLALDTSPVLAAILLTQSAQLAEQCQVPSELILSELQQAIDLCRDCALTSFVVELHAQMGMLLQRHAGTDRGKLLAAVRAYQQALQSGITGVSHPVMFAELQNNLGLCYLSMPQTESSAQLRTGIAIQSFRYGLESINQQLHSEQWARISMNLANALQYAPSSHPAENLVQAVEIYEQVLQVRSRARDPIAYALTIFNQANALAHLGMFKPAVEKASEAYKLFQWYDQGEAAASARELVENINSQRANGRRPRNDKPAADDKQATANQQEPQHGPVPAATV